MTLDIITLVLSGAAALLALLCLLTRQKQAVTGQDIARLRDEIGGELREVRTELVANVHSAIQTTAQLQAEAQKQASDAQNTRIRELTEQLAQRQATLQKTVTDQLQLVETRMKNSAVESEQKLENIRTTMAALLNSLQMGFRTLAIQKRSSEVWQVLGAVKSEFETFGEALAQAQKRIELAGADLEKLVGVRTRQIQRKLRTVTALPQGSETEET